MYDYGYEDYDPTLR